MAARFSRSPRREHYFPGCAANDHHRIRHHIFVLLRFNREPHAKNEESSHLLRQGTADGLMRRSGYWRLP
jgi:hypothetical protein